MGLEIVKPGVNINFIRLRPWAFALSAILIILGLTSLILKGGPRYGIDFAGGTIIQVKFTKEVKADEIRAALKTLNLKEATVQGFGAAEEHEYLIRTKVTSGALQRTAEILKKVLEKKLGEGTVEIRRVEMVGPKVGKDLREKALLALFYAILAIGIYISGRFEMKWGTSAIMAGVLLGVVYVFSLLKVPLPLLVIVAFVATLILYIVLNLRFALGAVIALIHDVFITVGMFSLLNKDIDLLIVAALLTIMGYSLNDTIVVFDRIRENMRKTTKESFPSVVNRSINETLSRTVLTSGTTLLTLLALFLLGGSVIHNFAFALLVGVMVGTYSSIFIASPILTALERRGFLLKKQISYKKVKAR
ncbi:MAG: protein translocase subunit SecF [Candidatus Desulfofervidaceae bacterium]|nr:protein translocase subunit SecF [Candidatus Desulfofervidaceae bacterium]